jgi:aryl-alcohol dehydrogenase-like predicted oxidoreductase
MIPIPGFKSVEQTTQNAGAMNFGPLTEGEMSQIQALVDEYRPE